MCRLNKNHETRIVELMGKHFEVCYGSSCSASVLDEDAEVKPNKDRKPDFKIKPGEQSGKHGDPEKVF